MNRTLKAILAMCCVVVLAISVGMLVACQQQTYKINIAQSSNGSVVADKEVYLADETATLTITAKNGYELTSLKVDGAEMVSQVANGKLTLTVKGDVDVQAEFTKIPTYKVTITEPQNGFVEADKTSYQHGATATLTIAPVSGYQLASIKVNGTEMKSSVANGKLTFVVDQAITVVAVFETLPPVDVVVSIADNANLDGMQLVVTGEGEDARNVTVADGKFTIEDAYISKSYTVTGKVAGMVVALGNIIVNGETAMLNVAENLGTNSGSVDLVNNVFNYTANNNKGGYTFTPVSPLPAGDVWFATKIKMSASDWNTLVDPGTGEALFGVRLNSGANSLLVNIRLKGANHDNSVRPTGEFDISLGNGDRSKAIFDVFRKDGANTAYGDALIGDGVYLVNHYDYETGAVTSYLGATINNVTKIIDWSTITCSANDASLPANATIDSIEIGYLNVWGECKMNVSYADSRVGASLAEVLGLTADVVATDDSTHEHGSLAIEGHPYGDVVLTLTPDADYKLSQLKVNGQVVDANDLVKDGDKVSYTLADYRELTVKVEATFGNTIFAVTTSTSDENIEIEVYEDGTLVSDLTRVSEGTLLTVKAIAADGYMLAEDSFTFTAGGETFTYNTTTQQYLVNGNVTISAASVQAATLSGKISAEHYNDYVDTLSLYVPSQKQGSTSKFVGVITKAESGFVHNWTLQIPLSYTNFNVMLEDSQDMLADVAISRADTTATDCGTIYLAPAMSMYHLWGTHQGHDVKLQTEVVYDGTQFTIQKTESGSKLDNGFWGDQAIGTQIAGVNSKYWIISTTITNLTSTSGSYKAGVTIGDHEFIAIYGKEKRIVAYNQWSEAQSASIVTDLVNKDYASDLVFGSLAGDNWAQGSEELTLTVVRSNKLIYVFVEDVCVYTGEISANMFEHLHNNNTVQLGLFVHDGAFASFKNTWHTTDQANIVSFLEERAVALSTSVNFADNVERPDAVNIQVLKETFIGGTSKWVVAGENDYYAGARLKVVVTAGAHTDTESYAISSVKVNDVALPEDGIVILNGATAIEVDVEIKGIYTVSIPTVDGLNIVVTDQDGNTVTGATKLPYGAKIDVTVTPTGADTYLANNGLSIKLGDAEALTYSDSVQGIVVTDNVVITAVTERLVAISGTYTLTTNGYDYSAYADEVTVNVGTLVGSVSTSDGVHTWTIKVPETATDIQVVLSSTGRFRDATVTLADTNATAEVANLDIEIYRYTNDWTEEFNFKGEITENGFRMERTNGADGNSLANKVAAYTFEDINSQHWVLEANISDMSHGAYSWRYWGILLGDKEYLMLYDRDQRMMNWSQDGGAYTGNKVGTDYDLVSNELGTLVGLNPFSEFAGKVAVVRDGNDIYIYLQDKFIAKRTISAEAGLWASLENAPSTALGFVSFHGTQLTVKDYGYLIGEEKVDAYFATKVASEPQIDVQVTGDIESVGATAQLYKHVLESVGNGDNNYADVTKWNDLTANDYYVGTYVKLVVTPAELPSADYSSIITVTIDGQQVTLTDNEYKFFLSKATDIDINVEIVGPFNAVVEVNEKVNLDGVTLTLTDVDNPETTFTKVVENGAFEIADQKVDYKYNVTANASGVQISLGQLAITGKNVDWNPASAVTSGSGSVDFANATYTVVGAEKGRVDINAINNSIAAGDVWVATKVQIPDLQAVLDASGEMVVGIEMRDATGRPVENVLWINQGNMWLLSGGWSTGFADMGSKMNFDTAKTALAGDGLYMAMHYKASSGLTYTYLGTSPYSLACIRDWGTGGENDPGWRSFEANSQIIGFGLGYVHCWTGNDANLRKDVIFANTGYGSTLGEALGLADVTVDGTYTGGTVTATGKPYGDVVVTVKADEGYTHGSVVINSQKVELDENGSYKLSNYNSATVDVDVIFSNEKFAVTNSSAGIGDATITVTNKAGEAIADISQIPYGSVITITATGSDAVVVKFFTVTVAGEAVEFTGNACTLEVTGTIELTCTTETSITWTGTIDAGRYAGYADELQVSAGDFAEYTVTADSQDANKLVWTLKVIEGTTDAVTISTANNRFRAITTANGETSKLVPMLAHDAHLSATPSDWTNLVYDAENDTYSIVITETGRATAMDDNAWVNRTTGYAFGGGLSTDESKQWIVSVAIKINSASAYNQYEAGVLIGDNQAIIIRDRDQALDAITIKGGYCWNNSDVSIISKDKAAQYGLNKNGDPTDWSSAGPLTITAVRQNDTIFVFLNGNYIDSYAINDNMFANIKDGSTKLGFMIQRGCQATFSNYYYETGTDAVTAYLNSQKLSAPSVTVTESGEQIDVEGATVKFQKQNADGTWVDATEADYYVGAYLKAVATAAKVEGNACVVTGIKYNGGETTENGYVFNYGRGDTIEVLVTVEAFLDVTATVNAQANLNGLTLTLTNKDDSSDVRTAVVTNGEFPIDQVARGTIFNVTVVANGRETSLGQITVDSDAVAWNPASAIVKANTTANNDIINLAESSYKVSSDSVHYLTFNFTESQSNDIYALSKVKITQADAEQIIASGEIFINFDLLAGDKYVQHAIQLKNKSSSEKSQLIVGTNDRWTEAGILYTVAEDGTYTFTDYGNALIGDGLYFGISYDYETGLVYTLIGASLDDVKVLRDWGTLVDSRSFAANTAITGYRFGTYFYGWGSPANVTFSDVYVSKTLNGAVNKDVLLDMSKASLKWESTSNTFGGVGYQNAKGKLSYDETMGAAKYTFTTIATHATKPCGKSFVPYFQGFSFTDISAYSTISCKVKIDETTCSEGFALNVRPFNKTAATTQRIVAGEWVE